MDRRPTLLCFHICWREFFSLLTTTRQQLRCADRPFLKDIMIETTCRYCGQPFIAKRTTAQYCSPGHRLAAHRGTLHSPQNAPESHREGRTALETLRDEAEPIGLPNTRFETLNPPTSRALPKGIVPDDTWPGMYRLRLPDGSLSDMVNLTRARDAAKAH
jgi:hypothetical protein